MTVPPRCDLCDLPLDQCVHGAAARRQAQTDRTPFLEVSPRGIAHLPGCEHKDDPNYSEWGTITIDAGAAWQALGNHNPVTCDAGQRPDRIATRRCRDCEARS